MGKPVRPVTRDYHDPEGNVVTLTHDEPVKTRRPRDTRENEAFVLGYLNGATLLARMNLTGTDLAVLFALVARMGYDEPFRYKNTEVAAELGLAAQSVSRSTTRLKQRGVLLDMGNRSVIIHPSYFWRGTKPGRMAMLHRLDKNSSGYAAETLVFRAEPEGELTGE